MSRERLLSRLGIAARDRDAAQITRDRATARAVALAARLAECTPEQQLSWRGRRLTRRLSKAVGRASVGTDPLQRAQLLDQLAARRHALALATVPLPSPWSPAHSTTTAGSVPSPPTPNAPVPVPGPHSPDEPEADRGPDGLRGPVPEIADSKASSSKGTEGKKAGTEAPEAGAAPGTGPANLEAAEGNAADAGTDRAAREAPGQGPGSYLGPNAAESATETTGDRGPSAVESGTETTGDRGHTAPLRRKTTTKPRTKSKGKRDRSRTPRTQRPPREPEQSVGQLAEQVRPHVPALLERDGNESVTRVQLREILRREGLPGGRNDRLSLVLQELRSDDTTKTRSTVR